MTVFPGHWVISARLGLILSNCRRLPKTIIIVGNKASINRSVLIRLILNRLFIFFATSRKAIVSRLYHSRNNFDSSEALKNMRYWTRRVGELLNEKRISENEDKISQGSFFSVSLCLLNLFSNDRYIWTTYT